MTRLEILALLYSLDTILKMGDADESRAAAREVIEKVIAEAERL